VGDRVIMAGYQDQKFVCYPISRAHEQRRSALINWAAEFIR
jgi:5-methylphenazine-1-carboxylate 1-monooxygenase